MSVEARIRELSLRHRELDTAIEAERKKPSGDDVRMSKLKREKLRLKDQIARLRDR